MNSSEFLKDLEYRLRLIPQDDRNDAVEYYKEYINDMELGENDNVEAILGTPKEVASKIIGDCTQKVIDNQKEKKTVKGTGAVIWFIILAIFSLPISLPLAIVAIAVVLVVVIVVFALLIALLAMVAAIIIGGFSMIPMSLMWAGSLGQKLFFSGIGIMATVLGIVLINLLFKFIGFIVPTMGQSIKKISLRRNK